jgi:hypothetical protein
MICNAQAHVIGSYDYGGHSDGDARRRAERVAAPTSQELSTTLSQRNYEEAGGHQEREESYARLAREGGCGPAREKQRHR